MFYKPKYTLVYIFISLALLSMGCESSPGVTGSEEEETDTGSGDETEETIEPTITISNPVADAELAGEVQITIDGEAEESFSELRILIDEEELATEPDPEMPYEGTVKTQEYGNGSYDLTAELDVAGEDTTVSETITVHFENHLLSVDTQGYIEGAITDSEEVKLYISAPDGTILDEADLTNSAGEIVNLGAPESLEEGAPEYINVSIATVYSGSNNSITTFGGIEPFEAQWSGTAATSSPAPDYNKDLNIEIENPPANPMFWGALSDNVQEHDTGIDNDVLRAQITVNPEANNLVTYLFSDYTQEDNIPLYTWEKDLKTMELSDGDTVRYNAETDLQKMKVHNIAHSSDLQLNFWNYWVSAEADSWESGNLWFPSTGSMPEYDQNSSSSVYGMIVPDTDHLFDLTIAMTDKGNSTIQYTQNTVGDLPDDFHKLEASASISGIQNFSNVSFDFTGSFDFARYYASNAGTSGNEDNIWGWHVYVPDSLESFTPPRITDIVNWETFTALAIEMSDVEEFDGFGDYLDFYWTVNDLSYTKTSTKSMSFGFQKRKAATPAYNHGKVNPLIREQRKQPTLLKK